MRSNRFPTIDTQVKKVFATPQDAEAAFYEALQRADLEAMMEVWSVDDEILCVHPGGPRLSGYDQVRASWAGMFSSGQTLRVRVLQPLTSQSGMIAIHNVYELISVGSETRARQPVIATNIYARTSDGWRMIVHHASPAPPLPERPVEAPKIFH
jgi:ketosteroid isomerase-like protein